MAVVINGNKKVIKTGGKTRILYKKWRIHCHLRDVKDDDTTYDTPEEALEALIAKCVKEYPENSPAEIEAKCREYWEYMSYTIDDGFPEKVGDTWVWKEYERYH